jgi:hypothetical protein
MNISSALLLASQGLADPAERKLFPSSLRGRRLEKAHQLTLKKINRDGLPSNMVIGTDSLFPQWILLFSSCPLGRQKKNGISVRDYCPFKGRCKASSSGGGD